MNLQEKTLYQQIHPLRLAVDWISGIAACYFFWQQELLTGLALSFIPSLLVSLFVIRLADFEQLKNSVFGKYFKRTYSKTVDLIRFAGFVIMASASWYHMDWMIAGGLVIIILTWTYGLVITKKTSA